MSIENLITKVANGDKESFEKLYNKTSRLVFSVSLSIVKNVVDAEDVMSETYISIWKNAKNFLGGNGLSWISAITRNYSINFINAKENNHVELLENYRTTSGIEGDVQNKMVLEATFKVLDEKERQTVLLHNSGYKHREIAEILNEKLGTITWRYNNALSKMKKALGGQYEE